MADDQLTAATRQYLTKVPPWILRGVDLSKLKVIQAPDNTGDNAIASIDTKNPNVIRVHNVAAYMAPGAGPQTLAHELTHVQQTKVVGGMGAFAPVNKKDPNSYDANNIDKRKVTDYSPEQLASMNQHYTADQTNPKLTPAQQAASSAQYMKIMQAQANMPMAAINPDQSGQAGGLTLNPTMNTAPQPPMAQPDYGIMPLPADQVVPQNSQPAASQWEDVPQGGSQGSPGDWEDVPAAAPQTYMQGVNQSAGNVLKGAGKMGLQLITGDPSVSAMTPEARVGQLKNDQELSADTASTNPAQTVGKVAAGASLLTAAGGEALTNGVRNLTQTLRGGGMGKLLDSNVSGALHTDLGKQLGNVAQEAGVDVKPTSDVRKLIGNVADAVKTKATKKMDELDQLFKGISTDEQPQGVEHYSDISKQIEKQQKDIAMQKSSTPATSPTTSTADQMSAAARAKAKLQATQESLNALKSQKQIADDALDAQGLRGAREEADRLFQQAKDLDALRKAHGSSTFGPAGQGQTNPVKFHEQLKPLHDSGQLSSAMGNEDNAQQLMNSTGESQRLMERNAKVRKGLLIGSAVTGVSGDLARHLP